MRIRDRLAFSVDGQFIDPLEYPCSIMQQKSLSFSYSPYSYSYSYSRSQCRPRTFPFIVFTSLPHLSQEGTTRAYPNAMTRKDAVKHDYHSQAGTYDDYMSSPIGVIEGQLFTAALGDCRGLTVLDLGGGTGRKQHLVFS